MATEILDRQLIRLRASFAKTPIPGFFGWWGTELLRCLPPRWRALLSERSDTLLLEHADRELIVWRERGSDTPTEFGRISLDQPPEEQAAEFARLRARIENPSVRTVLCIDNDRVLRRNVALPSAAEANLRQVLSFEMDRQTPFKADQVYFDSRVVSRDASGRNMQVEVVLMPRAQLDEEIAVVAGGALPMDGIDTWQRDQGHQRRHVNLLPVERRFRRRNMRVPIIAGLVLLAIILLLVNMALSLSNRSQAIELMRADVDRMDTTARKVRGQKQMLLDSIGGANFLAEKKRTTAPVIALIDDLTKRIPDNTFIERLNIENNQVQLQGQSSEAAKLIGLLTDSPYLANPNFQGPIQPDARSGKERFQITADLKALDAKAVAPAGGATTRADGEAKPKEAPAATEPPSGT
ncbi:MAG: PilN domain-containing protein [Dokdonella sp.]